MSRMIFHFFMVVLLASVKSKSFVSSAPADQGVQPEQEVSDEVQQLDDLRKEHGKERNNAIESKQHEPEPGPNSASMPQHPANDEHPQPEPTGIANSRSAIFRHRGITEAKKNRLYDLPKEDQSDEYAKFSGIQYSPEQLAAYIFRTGDEQGLALAIDELVREGMMGRTDAINYLQDVKEAVMYMKNQYDDARALEELNSRGYPRPLVSQRLPPIPREQFVSHFDTSKREPSQFSNPRPMTTAEPPHQVATASSPMPKMSTYHEHTTPRPLPLSGDQSQVPQKKEAAGMMDQNANALYDEYTMEEVLYQLAKDMFTQSMARGDQTAEDTLSRLITFVESEVDNKRISRAMKEKVLEIVSASLVDSLREYPGLLSDEPQLQSDSSQRALYRPGMTSMIADKRSAPEDAQKKLSLSGPTKLFQLNASNDKQKSKEEKNQMFSNSQNLQKASLSASRTKRT